MDRQVRVAIRWAIATSAFLTLLKAAVGLWTGSLAVLGSALDSGLDLAASTVNALFLRHAHIPADAEHPFGHGKAEGVASLLQGLLIGGSAAALLIEAIRRIIVGVRLQHGFEGMIVLAASAPIAVMLGLYLRKVARRTGSLALEADAAHYISDVASAGGAFLALLLIHFGAPSILDPVASILIAGYVGHTAWKILRGAYDLLLDRSLPDAPRVVEEAVARRSPPCHGFHALRARGSGVNRFVEFHVDMDRNLTFPAAHQLAEEITADVEGRLGAGTEVLVHADPFPGDESEPTEEPGIRMG